MFESKCQQLNKKNGIARGKGSYNIKEIADLLGICRDSASALVKREGFRCVRLGRELRVVKSDFDAWLDKTK